MNKLSDKQIIFIAVICLFILAIITVPADLLDATDVKDYSDTAKFFSGEYKAKHRAAHSITYGLLLSPYVKIADSFFLIKLASVFWLILTIISVYCISGRNRKALLLIILSPLVWYMAPWLSPVPAVSLLFLWAVYFLNKSEEDNKYAIIIYAGLLIGLSASLWDSALYFGPIFLISFFYNKKFYTVWMFIIGFVLGLLPRLIIDQIFFNFALYSILKNFFALLSFALYGGVYEGIYSVLGYAGYLTLLIFIPYYFYILYRKDIFLRNKKTMIFLTLCFILIILNPHIRMLIVLTPIMVLIMSKELNEKQHKRQIICFLILTALVVTPYIVQSTYETNARNFEKFLARFPDIEFNRPFTGQIIQEDLSLIGKEFPHEVFVVGNGRDDYKELAHLYWGDEIEELISIEDYYLFKNNTNIIADKRIGSDASSRFRTEMWIEVVLTKNSNDNTDYESINYAISLDKELNIEGFELIKRYKALSIYRKSTQSIYERR